MRPRVLILGGGVGGTIVANRLAHRLRRGEAEVVVVDGTGRHVYQPGLLYVPFSHHDPASLVRPVRRLLNRRVEFVRGTATRIDPQAQTTLVEDEVLTFDWLVLATGTRLAPERIPGFSAAQHFYDLDGATRLRAVLGELEAGRIVVGPSRKVYKCPPAPLEFVLLLDDHLRRRRLRDRFDLHFVSPFPEVFPGKKVARLIAPLLDARGIRVTTDFTVKEMSRGVVHAHDGREVRCDLAVLIPPHRVTPAIEAAGLAPEGWVPVEPRTLRVAGQPRIFALGDTTDLPIPKTGAVAHFQAPTVVAGILRELRQAGRARPYAGQVLCLIETGGGRATVMRFDYDTPGGPSQPTRLVHWAKALLNRLYWATIPSGRV